MYFLKMFAGVVLLFMVIGIGRALFPGKERKNTDDFDMKISVDRYYDTVSSLKGLIRDNRVDTAHQYRWLQSLDTNQKK